MSFFGFLRFFNRRSSKHSKKSSSKKDRSHSPLHNSSAISDHTAVSPSSTNPVTVSTTSSTSQQRFEGGRRFYDSEKVADVLPNDVEEDDRLHLQHWAIKLAFDSNFDAPVQKVLEEGTNVLDSACGPATWTLEMANTFPNSTFYGTDISSRFPHQIKPGNCEFFIHNILENPPFQENYFGYIHERFVVLGIKQADWPKLLENLTHTLKPGGWLELTEYSYFYSPKTGPNIELVIDLGRKVMTAAGLDLDIEASLPDLLSEAGLINIQTRQVDAPINHGGKIGQLFWENFKEGFGAVRAAFTKFHPEFEEPGAFETFIDGIGEDARKNEWTISFTRVIGQKPLLTEL